MNVRLLFISFSFLLYNSLFAQEYSLPLLVIETEWAEIPQEPKISGTLKVISNNNGINKVDDPATDYDGIIGIELRGSSSLWFDKKAYGFETRLADGSNNNVSILGLPKENDWILYAPYSDKSLMRNVLTYQIAGEIMSYAPRTIFCELIVNQDYKGVYVLMEKIKRDKNRVDISKLKPEDNSGDQLTGGYILKIDKFNGTTGFDGFSSRVPPSAGKDINIQYHYPKPTEITEAQKTYIENYYHAFESALVGDDFRDPINGYRKYIDITSFIDYQIITELSKNPDGYRISTFLHKDRDSIDSRFKMGPVWDYNLALGNVDYCTNGSPVGWVRRFNGICPDDFWLVPFWWNRLTEDIEYQKAFKSRWTELRAGLLSDEAVLARVDSMRNVIGLAAQRNFVRWPILGQYVWPNNFIGSTYAEEIDYLNNWLRDRMQWMDGQIENFGNPIAEPVDRDALVVKPNPASEEITFEFYADQTETITLKIYDSTGRFISEVRNTKHPDEVDQLKLNIKNFGSGLYFYTLWNKNELLHSGPFHVQN